MTLSLEIQIIENVNDAIDFIRNLIVLQSSLKSPSIMAYAPSLHLQWLVSFLEYYGLNRNIKLIYVTRKNEVVFLAALQQITSDSIEFLCDETTDYNDFWGTEDFSEALEVVL